MACLKVVALLVLIGLACGELYLPSLPCAIEDTKCLTKANQEFLQMIANGLPEHDIMPIEPMVVHDVVVPINDELILTFSSLKISGFQNGIKSDFKFNRDQEFMTFNVREKVTIDGRVREDYHKLGKNLGGTFNLSAAALIHIRLDYDVWTNDEGVKFMNFGQAAYSCEGSDVNFALKHKLNEAIENDADIRKVVWKDSARLDELDQKTACDIILAGYPTIIEDFRKLAVGMPISAFFIDF